MVKLALIYPGNRLITLLLTFLLWNYISFSMINNNALAYDVKKKSVQLSLSLNRLDFCAFEKTESEPTEPQCKSKGKGVYYSYEPNAHNVVHHFKITQSAEPLSLKIYEVSGSHQVGIKESLIYEESIERDQVSLDYRTPAIFTPNGLNHKIVFNGDLNGLTYQRYTYYTINNLGEGIVQGNAIKAYQKDATYKSSAQFTSNLSAIKHNVVLLYVDNIDANQYKPCTGILLNKQGPILTARHCLLFENNAEIDPKTLSIKVLSPDDTSESTKVIGFSLRRTHDIQEYEDLDLVILPYEPLPGVKNAKIKKINFPNPTQSTALLNEDFVILHYPCGVRKQHVTLESCRVLRRSEDNELSLFIDEKRFNHSCDTLNGSSGSPIFAIADNELNLIGIHRARKATATAEEFKIENCLQDTSRLNDSVVLQKDSEFNIALLLDNELTQSINEFIESTSEE